MNPRHDSTGVRLKVIDAIVSTAPDVAVEIVEIDDDVDLFEEFGLDSMDRMNIMTAIVEATGRTIRDEDYARLSTMNELVEHLS